MMPQGDRTGPFGEGPRTGRQLGYCADYNHPGYARHPGWGLGRGFFRRGGGRGRGFFRTGPPDILPEREYASEDLERLRSEIKDLKETVSSLVGRLEKLDQK
jgi:hypothetical protein